MLFWSNKKQSQIQGTYIHTYTHVLNILPCGPPMQSIMSFETTMPLYNYSLHVMRMMSLHCCLPLFKLFKCEPTDHDIIRHARERLLDMHTREVVILGRTPESMASQRCCLPGSVKYWFCHVYIYNVYVYVYVLIDILFACGWLWCMTCPP